MSERRSSRPAESNRSSGSWFVGAFLLVVVFGALAAIIGSFGGDGESATEQLQLVDNPVAATDGAEPDGNVADTAGTTAVSSDTGDEVAGLTITADPTADTPAADEIRTVPIPGLDEAAESTTTPDLVAAVPTASDPAMGTPVEDLPPLDSLPPRGAVFRPPLLYLEGPATAEEAAMLYQRAIEVVGPDNVVNNYIIRPDAPTATGGNVRIEQAVLFETGSSVITERFIPILEIGVQLMTINPQVSMTIEGHTDSVGPAQGNQVLSERRAQAVVAYLESRGVDGSRLSAVGYGESRPIADNTTEQGRQLNRRIEVGIEDLLSPRNN